MNFVLTTADEKNKAVKEKVYSKYREYLQRAEVIKETLQNRTNIRQPVSASSPSTKWEDVLGSNDIKSELERLVLQLLMDTNSKKDTPGGIILYGV